jgi:hypothetical protein
MKALCVPLAKLVLRHDIAEQRSMLCDTDRRGWPEQSRDGKHCTTSKNKSSNGSVSDTRNRNGSARFASPVIRWQRNATTT